MSVSPSSANSASPMYKGYHGLKEQEASTPIMQHNMSFRVAAKSSRYHLEELENKEHKIPLFPEGFYVFELLFLRMVYQRMEEVGYYNKEHKGVHISVFRRCMRRLLDMFNSDMYYDFEAFGNTRNATWIRWADIRLATESDRGLPTVDLSLAERIFMVLDGNMNSILGTVWGVVIFAAIIYNVFLIIVQSMHDENVCARFLDPGCHVSMDICSVIFSIDYFGRLLCSPWCRHGIFNTEWLIDHAVIDPAEVNAPMPTQASPMRRLWFFVAVPMHIIDLLSILPFWLNMLAGFGKIPLGFLRSLRLLRLFRVMKFGKFSKTLLVLGDTFRKSAQSIGVLILYIVMVSLMAGAVMYRFETEAAAAANEDVQEQFETVPKSLWWVVCRMVSMQHSLPGAHGIPLTWVSSLLIAAVGMFRGVIFVLPIGQITTAFKDAWSHQQVQDRLRNEVERSKEMPMGFEWTEDPASPVVRVELAHFMPDGEERDLDAYGALPLPLYQMEPVECCIWIKIHGSDMHHKFFGTGNPELYFHIYWNPSAESKPGQGLPVGNLQLRLLHGRGFPGNDRTCWGCRLTVPVRLHGEGANECWASGKSSANSPRPEWEHATLLQFDIQWATSCGPKTPSAASGVEKAHADQAAFQQRVLQLLEDQSSRIASLERDLASMESELRHRRAEP